MVSNFEQLNHKLNKFIANNTRPGEYNLSNMQKLMEYLGNPQEKLRIIHVAGTSGKTSTAYYISALLLQSDKKVGLAISPHIHQLNERLLINMDPFPEEIFCERLSKFLSIIDQSKLSLTYFEVLTAFAFWELNEQNVDYAIIEVGLGGLLDCTNVINHPQKISVITDIGIDHVKFLGNTIEEIAYQKAGIIFPGNKVFINEQNKIVIKIVQKYANKSKAFLSIVEDENNQSLNLELPKFQFRNFKLALAVYNSIVVSDALKKLNNEQILRASKINIPGRMQIININNKVVILDGSHNPQKIEALVDAVKFKYADRSIDLLIGFKNNTESYQECLTLLKKISDEINFTDFNYGKTNSGKTIELIELFIAANNIGFKNIKIFKNPNTAIENLLSQNNDHIILVTGTFFLLGDLQLPI